MSDAPQVDETHPLKPITDYSRFKMMCEQDLEAYRSPDFTTITIRPATVCGYSPRQRLDLTVNILTAHAVENRKIRIFGGAQMRPNIHIKDMVELYGRLIELPSEQISGKIFNAGYQNHKVADIAGMVKACVEDEMPKLAPIELTTEPTNDPRSYHISSELIAKELGFRPSHTVEDAIRDLCHAFNAGKLNDPLNNPRYHNVKLMKNISLA